MAVLNDCFCRRIGQFCRDHLSSDGAKLAAALAARKRLKQHFEDTHYFLRQTPFIVWMNNACSQLLLTQMILIQKTPPRRALYDRCQGEPSPAWEEEQRSNRLYPPNTRRRFNASAIPRCMSHTSCCSFKPIACLYPSGYNTYS